MYADNPPDTLSWLCEGKKGFYAYTMERFVEVAEIVKRKRENEARKETGG
jgi:hypothetical protein